MMKIVDTFGAGVETQVKHGPITILTMTQTRQGNLKLLAAQGQSIPGPVLQIDHTDSRLKFALGSADFINAWCKEGPTHHFALAREICRHCRAGTKSHWWVKLCSKSPSAPANMLSARWAWICFGWILASTDRGALQFAY
ncbi:MAG: hypothetical protein O3B43_06360 [Chloroflexi bacterium]|nr:hypothetical protein [Chloroflexota bacterium]